MYYILCTIDYIHYTSIITQRQGWAQAFSCASIERCRALSGSVYMPLITKTRFGGVCVTGGSVDDRNLALSHIYIYTYKGIIPPEFLNFWHICITQYIYIYIHILFLEFRHIKSCRISIINSRMLSGIHVVGFWDRSILPFSPNIIYFIPWGSATAQKSRTNASRNYMGGYQNYGPLLGPLNTRCRIIIGPQKGP